MKKQLFFVHGGEVFASDEDFYAFLKTAEVDRVPEEFKRWRDDLKIRLQEEGWEVFIPQMPNKLNADYLAWKIWFERYLRFCDAEHVVLVGHSLGANFLAKYIAENTLPSMVQQLHLVAGCYGWEGKFSLPERLMRVEEHCEKVFIYHSEDDFIVPVEDYQKYCKALPHAQHMLFQDKNHFLLEEFPELVANVLQKG